MATSKKTPSKKLPKSLRKGALPRSAEEVWSAGIGALAQARKTGSQSFDALVTLGGTVVDTGTGAAKAAVGQVEQAASAVTGTARTVADGALETVQGGVEALVETALGRIGVPGRGEILALRAQVDALQHRIAALMAVEEDAPTGTAEVAAYEAEVAAYEIVSHDRGWAVRRVGAERATSVHKTKKEALRDGRQTARAHAPSRLTVYKADGTAADETEYQAN